MDTYATCTEVLQLLGEKIPQTIDSKEMCKVIKAASDLVEDISDVKLLEMKEMDEKIRTRVKFYNLLIYAAHNARREMFPFFTCRVVQLTMEHGICDHGIHGQLLYDLLKSTLYVALRHSTIILFHFHVLQVYLHMLVSFALTNWQLTFRGDRG